MKNTLLDLYFNLPHDRSLDILSKGFNRLIAKVLKRNLDNKSLREDIGSKALEVKYTLAANKIADDNLKFMKL